MFSLLSVVLSLVNSGMHISSQTRTSAVTPKASSPSGSVSGAVSFWSRITLFS